MSVGDHEARGFGSLLRRLRVQQGLTLEELKDKSGVSVRAIGNIERGVTRKPQTAVAKALADALSLRDADYHAFMEASRGHLVPGLFLAAEVPTPTQALPPSIDGFTGREYELGLLTGQESVYAISGMAGAGKTTLATHAAHLLAHKFPDGQFFLPMHGHSPGRSPVRPEDALTTLLLMAGRAAQQIPEKLEPCIGAWRTYLAGKRVLLLLDDAADSEQVLPLLPGTSESLVIVTSRRHLTDLPNARAISVGVPDAEDAADMLVNLADRPDIRVDGPVRDLVRLCGYLPLAIRLVAGKLAEHTAWSAENMVTRLTAARSRLDLLQGENLSVASTFDLSYRDLTPEQARMLRRLGLHPGADVDDYEAAALDDSDPESARRVLDALYHHSLLAEWPSGRYVLHDLIREHARALAAADAAGDRDAALERLLDYYLYTARAADQYLTWRVPPGVPGALHAQPAFKPGLPTLSDAITWMEAERGNLQAAVDYAVDHGLLDYAIALPSAMHGFMVAAGFWEAGKALEHIAISAAGDAGDEAAEADALTDLSHLRYITGDFAGARRSVDRALEMQRRLGSKRGEANALACFSRLQHAAGKHGEAKESLGTALDLYNEIGDRLGEAGVRYVLGVQEYHISEYSAATKNLSAALSMFRSLGHMPGEAGAVAYLGAVQGETGDYGSAIANQKEAVRLYRLLKDLHEEAGALFFLGELQRMAGDYGAAETNLQVALEMYRAAAERFGEAGVRNGIGILREWKGDHAAAIESLNLALELYRGLGSPEGEATVLGNLGAAQSQAGDYQTALVNLNLALGMHSEMDNSNGVATSLNNLGELSFKSGSGGDALTYHEMALEIATRINFPLEEARALEGISRCEYADGGHTKAEATSRQALAVYQRIRSPRAARVEEFLRHMMG
jgi:tetratricopeptide (TPR) repeat protein/transcriptional regulator with XRE-family HTH domain